MLSTSNKKTFHQCCINVLLTKAYKHLNNLSSELMNEVFYLHQNHYNLCSFNVSTTDNPHNKYLLNSTVSHANQLWQTLLSGVKDYPTMQLFRKKIKLVAVINM